MDEVYEACNRRFVLRKGYLKLLMTAKDKTDLIKVITGVRRCGKSTLMDQFILWLGEQGVPESNILHFDLESIECRDISKGSQIIDAVVSGRAPGMNYVFIDEVQRLDGWEDCLNRLGNEEGLDVYVTGSNAFILSSELSTYLTGREFEVKMLPLSFREFLELNPPDAMNDANRRFMDYIAWGGMPAVDLRSGERYNRQLLQGIFGDIVFKDITARLPDRVDTSKLRATASFLFSNVGNPANTSKMAQGAGVDAKTMSSYAGGFLESYMFYFARRYDIIGGRLLNSTGKYYAVDTGMRSAVLENAAGDDISRPVENIVFLELLRRGYTVTVGSYRDKEVDFAAMRDGELELYQVALTVMDDQTFERERRSFADMKNGYRKTILTLDSIRRDPGNGIRHLNIIDWLLSE